MSSNPLMLRISIADVAGTVVVDRFLRQPGRLRKKRLSALYGTRICFHLSRIHYTVYSMPSSLTKCSVQGSVSPGTAGRRAHGSV